MASKIDRFVSKVAKLPSTNDLHNMYFGNQGKLLCENLVNYLNEMARNQPTHVLIGEAAGPYGACRTGIPFTDEQILSSGQRTIGKQTIFTLDYHLPFLNGNVVSEQSAQKVWTTIANARVLPLMWNAVPYYPHKSGDFDKIRNPRKDSEVRTWSVLVKELCDIFPSVKYHAAVGRLAQIALIEAFGWPPYIKHPSRSSVEFSQKTSSFLKSNGNNILYF